LYTPHDTLARRHARVAQPNPSPWTNRPMRCPSNRATPRAAPACFRLQPVDDCGATAGRGSRARNRRAPTQPANRASQPPKPRWDTKHDAPSASGVSPNRKTSGWAGTLPAGTN